MNEFNDELVDRSAPRWAWDIIDQTLANDAVSIGFCIETRADIRKALEAMVIACESPQMEELPEAAVAAKLEA